MPGASKKLGRATLKFADPPVILDTATVVGPKEGQGPLGKTFDKVVENNYFGEESWEKAERKMLEESIKMVIQKRQLAPGDVDFLLAGDLLNQDISANFAARQLPIPFLGLFGACSTMMESLALGAMLLDGGYANHVVSCCSSHYSTAERQFRFPTEQGVQRPPSAQWTVTGAAAFFLAGQGQGPRLTHATIGRVVDMGLKDAGDMGAAMAPAAAETIINHFKETGRNPADYDLIFTGDLGMVGKALLLRLLLDQGYRLDNYNDCGILIFDPSQDTHSGGSGCACSGVVTGGYIVQEFRSGRLKKALGVGTGALLSPTSMQQGESIPCIAHAISIEA